MDTPQDSAQLNKDGELLQKLAALEKERDEYLNGWKRAKADLINSQKDEQKRFQEFMQYANESSVRELIPILSSFELGISAMEKSGSVDKGVYIIKGQLEDVLKKRGLEKIKVSPGDPFDPAKHESIGEVEGANSVGDPEPVEGHPSGTIAEEIESGYTLQGKVVKPARVKIIK